MVEYWVNEDSDPSGCGARISFLSIIQPGAGQGWALFASQVTPTTYTSMYVFINYCGIYWYYECVYIILYCGLYISD